MSKPSISVVIPAYNSGPLLRDVVRAAAGQSRPPLEILVVDDASPEALDLAGLPVRVIRLDRNVGTAGALNVGVDAAKGDVVAFLDHDDLWSPHTLRLHARAHAEQGVDSTHALIVNMSNGAVSTRSPAPRDPDTLTALLLESFIVSMSGFTARKDVLRRVGPFDTRFRICGDLDFYIRLFREHTTACVPYFLVHRNVTGASMTRRFVEWARELGTLHATYAAHDGYRAHRGPLTFGTLRTVEQLARNAKRDVAARREIRRVWRQCLLRGVRSLGPWRTLRCAIAAHRERKKPARWPTRWRPGGPSSWDVALQLSETPAEADTPFFESAVPLIVGEALAGVRALCVPASDTRSADDRMPLSVAATQADPPHEMLLAVPSEAEQQDLLGRCACAVGDAPTFLAAAGEAGLPTLDLRPLRTAPPAELAAAVRRLVGRHT